MAGNLEQALEYASQGYRVFPLFYVVKGGLCSCRSKKPCKRIGKHPMTQNGVQDATLDEAQIRQWWTETPWANIGLATGHDGLIVMDVDDAGEKTGSETLKALVERYGSLPETRMVRTGSGGRHFYFYSTHEITNSASKVGKYIDIRGYGGYVILPPSNHASGDKYQWLNDLKPADMPEWLEKLATGNKIDLAADAPDENGPAFKDARRTADESRKFTPKQLLMLLDFIPPDCDRDVWWQVGAALKKELGDDNGFEVWDKWSKKAKEKYDPKMMGVQWSSFTDKGITGGTIFHYAKMLGDFRGFNEETAKLPKFVDVWCYVAKIKRFVDCERFLEYDTEQFNAVYARDFTKGKASDHVLRNDQFRVIEEPTYWPERERIVTEEDGLVKLNYWRPSGVTARRGDVEPFLNHIKYLFPEGLEGKILLEYLAFQVQHPGEKVHWAVLLGGVQGTGKSYFAEVMRRVLGPHNVKMVTNERLHETFTGWQRNTQLVVVEEMMARERLELMNKLKPMITESWCQIREMYRPPYDQPNRFNFLFFTNHDNALILDNTDRRYCILRTKSPAHPDGNAYYGPLFDWTRKNAAALLWYLKEEVKLDGFQAKAHAPMTEAKRAMIDNSLWDIDRFIRDQVEAKEFPCGGDLLQPASLVKPCNEVGIKASPRTIADALRRLDYLDLGLKRIEGENKINLWACRNFDLYREMSPGQLRAVWARQASGKAEEWVVDMLAKMKPADPLEKERPM